MLDPSYKSGIVESSISQKLEEEFHPKTEKYDERKGGKESSV